MYGGKTTLYEILGVSRDAKHTDIGRAYNRLRAEMQDEDAPPDPRRAALIKDAYEILSDLDRREAYDASLRNPKVLLQNAGHRINPLWAAGALVLAVAAAAAWWVLRPKTHPRDRVRTPIEIANAATVSIGRLQSIDMSGRSTPLGLAFAVEEGVMATSCTGISPGAELVVNIVPRVLQAHVMMADDFHGLCKLAVQGVGGWPLALSGVEPRPGEKVYAASVNAVGEVVLKEGTVTRVVAEPKGRIIETTIPMALVSSGSPLLDGLGRVLAIASVARSDGQGRYVAVPRAWSAVVPTSRSTPPVPAAAAPEPKAPEPAPEFSAPKKGEGMSKERREALEKAFRPPPSVPDDL
ncbi:MAG: DnaJ domain-containing protein [Usitatibacter sp.]